ncbi:alpha/beta fold hydrolase [Aquimarina algicola]|uniref:Alpha/beta hydrolase n=1 Tax=Aquimarina algicola TaxID=2589995 RepID=A0A504JEP2_9FLAO|nr:alpha/beta hydrolase [Aquimarina algicola]TPN86905.1 alpha/beta hydrolase [Aquimarina algicola]
MKTITSAHTEDRTSMSIRLSDNRILSYSTYGPEDGIPFIVFHGSPGSRISAENDLCYQLGIKMIYPERPGYGNSSPNPKASFLSWATDINEFLNHLQLEKTALGGVSGGGPYAMACAAQYPHRFTSLSLISSAAPQDLPGYKNQMAISNKLGYLLNKYTPFLIRSISKSFARGLKNNPERTFNQVFKQLCEADKNIICLMKKSEAFQIAVDHLQEAFSNGVEGHVTDMKIFSRKWNIPYQEITCLIHIWHGEDDTLAPILGAKELANLLPNAKPNYIKNAGHLLTEDSKILSQILSKVKESYFL